MTEAAEAPRLTPRNPGWWLRPRIALPLVAALLVALALLTPEPTTGPGGDGRLTTYSTGPRGAGALYELARRLGWRVGRQAERGTPALEPGTVRAILAPVEPLTATEVHAVLEHVRRGGALLAVLSGERGPLEDSLGVRRQLAGVFTPTGPDPAEPPHEEQCAETRGPLTAWPTRIPYVYGLRWTSAPPVAATVFAEARLDKDAKPSADDSARARPAALGYSLGAGRVVVASDADMFRNDVLRVCAWDADVVTVRMLEYLATGAPPRGAIVFDEYHQGFGAHPGSTQAVLRYLGETGSGRALLQLAIAALVLLAAAAPRPLPPRDDTRVERRSPLEHVDALSRAYARVHASRTVVHRLLHGVRRRAGARLRLPISTDDSFLEAAAARHPELADDVRVIRRSLSEPVSSIELEHTGHALERLESSLTTPRT